MNDDIVTKLEFLLKEGAAIIKDQADEIEHLRLMAINLVDELRQNGGYEAYTPEMLFQEFYDEAHRGDR